MAANMVFDIILVIGAYLLGSFPYMLLRARMKGYDISQGEDMHLAFMHKVGLAEGIIGILVDILKGIIPVVVGFMLHFQLAAVAAAGIAGVCGQMWPVFQRFDGEKGNTAGLGMAVAITIGLKSYWVLTGGLACAAIGVCLLTIPRMLKGKSLIRIIRENGPHTIVLPVCMLAAFAVMPKISWLTGQPIELTLVLAALFFFIAVRRITADLDKDLKTRQASVARILLNRFLLDRSYV